MLGDAGAGTLTGHPPPPGSSSVKAYRPELDGLRAVAVVAVFAWHTGFTIGPGFLGVNIFFVLSGYLITSLLLVEQADRGTLDYKAFFRRRLLRLYPALVGVCILVAALAAFVSLEPAWHAPLEMAAALTYVMDFVLASNHGGVWLSHAWSLGVEEQFYLVWPFALVLLTRQAHLKLRIAVLTVVLAIVPVASTLLLGAQAVQYSPLGAAFQLIAGALLAVTPFRVPRGTWVLAVLAYGLVWVAAPDPRSAMLQYGPVQLFTATAVLLAAWALTHVPRVLTQRAVVWFGRRSYGVYLYHLPILLAMRREVASRSVGVTAAFCATVLVAAASYRWIETPFLRMKRQGGGRPAAHEPSSEVGR
jgi:peptidoglycan/LPS O-acetylase OafA/YrhL